MSHFNQRIAMQTRPNIFEQLDAEIKAPESLKKQVMHSISLLKYVTEVVDLFTIKQALSYKNMLRDMYKNNKPTGERSSDNEEPPTD